jgi:hypothetical protein
MQLGGWEDKDVLRGAVSLGNLIVIHQVAIPI